MSVLYILLAIVALGVMIVVHEFGHFIMARLTGIGVREYSIGFGPKLVQWHSKKHDTVFSLRPIPLGGYCMFYGDTDDDPDGALAKDDPRNYANAAVWKRMLTVVSGPLMNFVLAFVLAVVLMASYGVSVAQPTLDLVEPNMPAAEAGLQEGDVILSVEGQALAAGDVQALTNAVNALSAGDSLQLTVRRGSEELPVTLTPRFDEAEQRLRVGVTIRGYGPMPASQVIPAAWENCVYASTAILKALGGLVTTGAGIEDTAGPVGVVQMIAQQTQAGGLEVFLQLVVIISINLGLMNLLPIPGLDGSRLVFMLIEAVRRKPVSQRVEATIHMCGYLLLFGVMIFFTFKDVLRIFAA